MIIWDYIVVGGGIAGSVISNRLHEKNPHLRILLIEAGPDTHRLANIDLLDNDAEVIHNHTWDFHSTPQVNLNDRKIATPQGKGLGGGTAINGAAWVRGNRVDYDIWADTVADPRWSYEGQLPYMRKTETHFDNLTNPSSHGHEGRVKIQSPAAMGRTFPLREPVIESWEEIGIATLPQLDGNAGNNLGVANMQESRNKGKRQPASLIYSQKGVTVLTDTLVARVLLEKRAKGKSPLISRGVQLSNGTTLLGRETILTAGAYRTPQILMLSGIGPADVLEKFGIPVLLDQPSVGRNLHDHILLPTSWSVKNPSAGYSKETGNPLFHQPQYKLGGFIDLITVTPVPKNGLADAIAMDEGSAPDPKTHPLLKQDRAHSSFQVQCGGVSADGSSIMLVAIVLISSARGSVIIQSADIKDAPIIGHRYLSTNVDRYVARETIKRGIRLMSSNDTVIGRDVVAGESSSSPLSINSTDEEIDARIREMAGSCHHPSGTAAMGTVVDTDLRVIGVSGLRVADASVFPISVSANIQVAVYALAEQAAEMMFSNHQSWDWVYICVTIMKIAGYSEDYCIL
ncbi:GMC oxidoreductase [Colletotrichum graminicola M1.001]|uniref:GMC oxidoreductase n=1 Tax=Colletotrichum graminicola (strain M1.001 / M2 / FGSC 10212) TaxID=645133 RepID=E3QHG0_COLGM|nr:GMC oxidoreductase [Colletotrichum graminicola M1.001]EFQ30322.1 GMC oxidoreductase [Colletotrichum graminicola M1.001]